MRINFLVNEVFEGWEPTDTRLGGTEESVVWWAEELAKRGHTIVVYRNGRDTEHVGLIGHNGVQYQPRQHYYGGGDICINIKSSDIAPKEPTLYLTNETNASDLDLSKYLGVIWPSEWAAENIPVNNPRKFILPHGYDPEQIKLGKKIPKQCLYASSPDRGLYQLLDIWPQVVEAHPDAQLIVTYGGEGHIDVPNVMFMGEVDESTMNDLYATSDLWLHPCSGGELYCIVGKKAQAAGCIPVIIPTMALQETVARGFKVDSIDNYAKTVIDVLSMTPEMRDAIRKDVLDHAFTPTWAETTDRLIEIVHSVV